ncbi:hypothetical protein [Clostridium sp.]|uniref:hypothetical protein n=1 Tax=Clostridium sp. TaxID=1506 RepID=UPI003D6D98B4
MKKVKLILFVIVITSIAIIFSKNIKSNVRAENLSLNKDVYNFLQDKGNRIEVYNVAVELNKGSSENTCVYFLSEVLRKNNFEVPQETSNTEQLLSLLSENGFKKQSNYKKLIPGDICFTTDANGEQSNFPTHTYIFMKWVKEGDYDYAYVCDNQAKDYKGKIYHIRNINVVAMANGFDKDAFAFFMKRT